MNIKRSVLAACVLAGSAFSVGAETSINALFMAQAAYSEADIKSMTNDFEKANPGVKVALEFVPYEALHDKIVAANGSGGAGYDVVLFDVIWPAEFVKNKLLTDVTSRIPASDTDKVFPGAWTTVSYDGKKWGMPWILDTKYLFYNKEILSKAGFNTPPKTWDELQKQAEVIKSKGLVKYPLVGSWSQSEAIVCDYTTLALAHQGKFFDGGKPAFDKGGALDAAKFMVSSLKAGLTNPNSKEYLEEDVRKVFSNGEAAFALNWTYMYNLANDAKESKVAGKVGVVAAPGVAGKSTASAVNGSMGLGIPPGSQHKEEAWKFIAYLTSASTQNRYAKLSLPIWKDSLNDPEVTKGQEELINAAKQALPVMAGRPETAGYTKLSNILQKQLQNALLGTTPVEEAMKTVSKGATRL